MWSKGSMNFTRLKCLLTILGLSLSQGLGQNAEPGGDGKRNGLESSTLVNRSDLITGPSSTFSTTTQTPKQPFIWEGYPGREEGTLGEGKNLLDRNAAEEEEEVKPLAMGDKDGKGATSTSASPSGDENSSRGIDAATLPTSVPWRKSRDKDVERRRRRKQFSSVIPHGKESNATISGVQGQIDTRLNNVRQRPRKEGLNRPRGKVSARKKPNRSNAEKDKKLKEAKERRRKLRMERRRRRNRERKRRNKLHQDNRKVRKQKQPLAQNLAMPTNPEFNETKVDSEHSGLTESGVKKVKQSPKHILVQQQRDDPLAPEPKRDEGLPNEEDRERQDNVEREFSKQVERELSKSEHVDENILPTLEKNWSKFPPVSPKRSKAPPSKVAESLDQYADIPRFSVKKILHSINVLPDEREASSTGDSNISGLMSADHPILMEPKHRTKQSEDSSETSSDLLVLQGGRMFGEEYASDDENLKGDLSCINGTFLPAPFALHALIRYVKSSKPGHEYLEADYKCLPGYYMVTPARRLLCNNRRWVGFMPKCKLRQNPNDVCADSPCEQVCRDANGNPTCSCYRGFRQEGNKCIDINECDKANGGCQFICLNVPGSYRCECPKGMKQGENRYTCMDVNECLLNNGHGPCQDTCHNVEGGYRCSCEGLPGTMLGANNHTCQDAGPCDIGNAGCSHTCLSTMGRVFCLCPDGFMLEDDWKTCQDVDECAVPDLQSVVCQHGCINTPGSYRCADPPEMRDEPPSNLISKLCDPGFEATVNGGCVDIDECAVSNGGCLEVCENTIGSYFCACDGDERLLAADGRACVDINDVVCPALNPSGRGYVMCSRLTTPKPWRGRKRVINRPGTKCFLRCPYGYQLRGEYELTCGTNGNWFGSKHGECVRYSKPRLDCPPNIIAEVPPGQSEAFVTYAQPSTDLDWFRYVRSEPSWGTRLEANLVPGEHKVTFIAKHPVSKKQATCILYISVKPGEAPRIKNCPQNVVIHGQNRSNVTWTEPIFTDNVKVTNIISNENPGHSFPVGDHKIHYEASDEAGWTATCDFLVTVRGD